MDLLERLDRPPAVAALDGEDSVYVVGGAVRDLLLGREPRELDFVVEGDALAVARRVGGRVVAHERFGTATVSVPGATFDLASARRERYERPGALPEVELGATLREDLERRDFTVNAIALHLADGELTWVPRAHEDLDARRLRVLHDRSFIDDPTRLLRLVRYAARLGFEPEERTDRLAAEAIAGGALDTVTGSRLGAELRLLLREPQPARADGAGAARTGARRCSTTPSTRTSAGSPSRTSSAGRSPRWLRRWSARMTCARSSTASRSRPNDARSRRGRCAARMARGRPDRPGSVRDGDGPSDDRRRTCGVRCAASAPRRSRSAGALGQRDAARRWLDDLRHRRLAIDGNDLVAAGLQGPAVGAGLAAAMEAMLEGRADTREEQLAAALA